MVFGDSRKPLFCFKLSLVALNKPQSLNQTFLIRHDFTASQILWLWCFVLFNHWTISLYRTLQHSHLTSFVSVPLKIILTDLFLSLFNFSVTYSFLSLFQSPAAKFSKKLKLKEDKTVSSVCFIQLRWNCVPQMAPSEAEKINFASPHFSERSPWHWAVGIGVPFALWSCSAWPRESAKMTLYPGGYALSFQHL